MARWLTVIALLAAVGACTGSTDDFGAARRLLDDESAFLTGIDAGTTFAEISDLLLRDAEDCVEDDHRDCDARFSAAAFARVTALRVLGCTAPDRHDARLRLAAHLDAIEAGEADSPPPAPSCPSP